MHHRASGKVKRNGGQKKIMNKVNGTLFWKHPPEDRHMDEFRKICCEDGRWIKLVGIMPTSTF
jgi:hypothetical protein